MLFVLLLFFSSAQPFFPPLRLKEMALWFFFPPLVCQSTNRFQCFVCVLEGSRHQLQVWTMSEKLVQLFSLCLSVCACLYSWERARDLLWACIVCLPLSLTVCRANTETEWCILLNRRSRQQSCQCGDAVSFSTVKELKHVPYKPQLTWGEEVSVFLPEKCFCANVCCLCAW